MDTVEMPDRLAENLIIYIRENNGTLGRKRRENEFAKTAGHDGPARPAEGDYVMHERDGQEQCDSAESS